jgi:hypothetical protein
MSVLSPGKKAGQFGRSSGFAITLPSPRRRSSAASFGPFKTRSVYPEAFYEAYDRWKKDKEKGTAVTCSTSLQDFLKQPK